MIFFLPLLVPVLFLWEFLGILSRFVVFCNACELRPIFVSESLHRKDNPVSETYNKLFFCKAAVGQLTPFFHCRA